MERVEGLWWPEGDREGRRAALATVSDLFDAMMLCREHRVCVQAGGNCGVWANCLAERFDEVWTAEPDWQNYLCMVRNVRRNVRTIWGAFGAHAGAVGLVREEGNAGAHYVEGEGCIPVLLIDELDLPACDLIVLDIEGMEPEALIGAQETIRKFKPILMVEDKGLSERYGQPKDWTADIPGYRVARHVHRDVVLAPHG